MKKSILLLLLIIFVKTQVFGEPLHGTGWVKTDFTYSIHKPWNVNVNERYQYLEETNEHHFWVFKDDEPFKQGDHTSPRCEMRINNNYTSGNHQFEADFYAVEGSDRPCVMQVWLGFMLKISGTEEGGSYWWHQSKELKKNIYGKWVHVNIVHVTSEGKVYIYMDGEFITSVNANITSDEIYFKCGIYTTQSDKSEVWIKNINYYIQSGTSDVNTVEEKKSPVSFRNGVLHIDSEGKSHTNVWDFSGKLQSSTFSKEIPLRKKGFFIVQSEVDGTSFQKQVFSEKIVNY